jgi:hypothetical protein
MPLDCFGRLHEEFSDASNPVAQGQVRIVVEAGYRKLLSHAQFVTLSTLTQYRRRCAISCRHQLRDFCAPKLNMFV